MQAVVERTLSENTGNARSIQNTPEYTFINDVIDGCNCILRKSTLAKPNTLRFAPVRIFIRITWSSVFLLKAISLGVWTSKLQESLAVLEKSVRALRESSLDEMHLASKYATLIERHVERIKRSFMVSGERAVPREGVASNRSEKGTDGVAQSQHHTPVQPPEPAGTAGLSSNPAAQPTYTAAAAVGQTYNMPPQSSTNAQFEAAMPIEECWLSLPFDPSMAPLRLDSGTQYTFPGLEGDALDFIWGL